MKDLTLNDAIRIRVKVRRGEWTVEQAAELYGVPRWGILNVLEQKSALAGLAAKIKGKRMGGMGRKAEE